MLSSLPCPQRSVQTVLGCELLKGRYCPELGYSENHAKAVNTSEITHSVIPMFALVARVVIW